VRSHVTALAKAKAIVREIIREPLTVGSLVSLAAAADWDDRRPFASLQTFFAVSHDSASGCVEDAALVVHTRTTLTIACIAPVTKLTQSTD
jgi:hypothetical protein